MYQLTYLAYSQLWVISVRLNSPLCSRECMECATPAPEAHQLNEAQYVTFHKALSMSVLTWTKLMQFTSSQTLDSSRTTVYRRGHTTCFACSRSSFLPWNSRLFTVYHISLTISLVRVLSVIPPYSSHHRFDVCAHEQTFSENSCQPCTIVFDSAQPRFCHSTGTTSRVIHNLNFLKSAD